MWRLCVFDSFEFATTNRHHASKGFCLVGDSPISKSQFSSGGDITLFIYSNSQNTLSLFTYPSCVLSMNIFKFYCRLTAVSPRYLFV
jgi:hypothetical protein